MSQPQNVPLSPVATPHYASPPRRDREWAANRPGDVFASGQPDGDLLGSQGPDQGFAIKLAKSLEDEVSLTSGEHFDDTVAGCVAVALKRASSFGRAPTIHDVRCAFTIFGFLDSEAPKDLVTLRKSLFEEVHHPHHYAERRAIADAIPTEFLRRPHAKILDDASDWESVLASVID
ncbi:MAG: hypothetical protein AAF567_24665 [Actinomycetota bacterium]